MRKPRTFSCLAALRRPSGNQSSHCPSYLPGRPHWALRSETSPVIRNVTLLRMLPVHVPLSGKDWRIQSLDHLSVDMTGMCHLQPHPVSGCQGIWLTGFSFPSLSLLSPIKANPPFFYILTTKMHRSLQYPFCSFEYYFNFNQGFASKIFTL